MTQQAATGILESISDAVVAIDRQWRYTYVNTAAERLNGHRRDEMLGRTHWEIFPAVDRRPSGIAYRRAMDERVTVHFDEHDAESDKWFTHTAYPTSNGIVVHTQDITDRKRAEEAIRKGEERFRRYFELGLIGMAITSADKGILDVNDEICTILGYERNELLQTTWAALTHPDDLAAHVDNFNRVMAGEIDGYSIEKRWIRKDGQVIHATISVKCLRRQDGSVDYFVALLQDITERKREEEGLHRAQEQKLRQANARITEILESIADAFAAWDRNFCYTYVNERAAQILGKPKDQLIGRCIWDLFPEFVGTEGYHKCRQAMSERVPVHFEAFFPELNRWYENHLYPTKEGLTIYWSEITERKRAEQQLRRSEAYLAEGQKLSHTGSGSWNVATGEAFWSDETYRIYGFDPGSVVPSSALFFGIVHPDDRLALQNAFEKVAREASAYELQFRIIRPDGMTRHIHSVGRPLFDESGGFTEVIGTVMDVTERKHAAEALRKAQAELAHISRVTTLGAMITSIAHEINQPLAAIAIEGGAALKWLRREIPDLNEARRAVERIVENSIRAGEVIKKIRSLATRTLPEQELLSINEIIQEVIGLAANDLTNNGVDVHTELQPDFPPVRGDRIPLQQVMLNLILNSNDAMSAPDCPVRELVIKSHTGKPGEVVVSVQDCGHGLNTTDPERIFDPFFSTKTGGLGLGLWISRTIVEAHGGRIWATQNPGKGATLQFTLPVIA